MKVINNDRATIALSVVTQKAPVTRGGKTYQIAAGVKRLELRPGKSEVSVTKEFAKQLESDPVVLAMVREGTLRFPDIESFEEIHATREGDIARRVKRITKAPIDEEEAVESGADAAKVKSLEAQVKALTQVVEGLTDAGKTAKQATTKKATTKKAADKTAGGK